MPRHNGNWRFPAGMLAGVLLALGLVYYDALQDEQRELYSPTERAPPLDVELVCEWRWPDGTLYRKL